MPELVVVFRTPSHIEADVVRGLLEANGIRAMISADMSRTPFPLTVHEHRVSVAPEDSAAARGLIESHRDDRESTAGMPLGSELEPLEKRIGYRFRDRG